MLQTSNRAVVLLGCALAACLLVDPLAAAQSNPSRSEQQGKTVLSVEDVLKLARCAGFSLSSNGAWLAYRVFDGVSEGIQLEDIDAGRTLELAPAQSTNYGIAWSPDSRRLAYYTLGNRRYVTGGARQDIGSGKLWIWDRATQRSRLIESVEVLGAPTWFKDGARLLVPLWPEGVAKPLPNTTPESKSPFRPAFSPAADDAPSVYVYRANQSVAKPDPDVPEARDANADFPADLGIIDIESGQVTRIARQVPLGIFHAPSPDGRDVAYATFKRRDRAQQLDVFDLHVVNLASAKDTVIAANLYNFAGKIFTWSPDSRWLAHLVLRTKSEGSAARFLAWPADLAITSMSDGTTKVLKKDRGPVFSGAMEAIWNDDSRRLYAVDVDRSLWEVDTASGDTRSVSSAIKGKTQRFISLDSGDSHRQGSALLKVEPAGKSTAAIYELNLRAGTVSHLFDHPVDPDFLDASAGAGRVAFITSSQQSPGALWLWRSGQKARQFGSLNRFLDDHLLGDSRRITWRTADGKELAGSLLLPQSYRPGQKLPLFTWVYGGLMGSRYLHDFGFVVGPMGNLQILASRGYAVLYPDMPQQLGTPMQDILLTAMPGIDAAIAQGFVDPDRLAVGGHSYGSYTTLALITQTTRFKAAIISGVEAPDLTSTYLQLKPNGGDNDEWAEHGQGLMGGAPWQYPQRYRDNSPIFLFDRIETPLLMGQGEIDTGTPITGANAVFVALRRLGKPVEYRIYENEGHVIHRPANVIDWWNRRLDFLAEHLDIQLDDQGRVIMEDGRAKSRSET